MIRALIVIAIVSAFWSVLATAGTVQLSGDCTLAVGGAITCTKSNGTPFGTAAFQSTSTFLQSANNLSDLGNASTARTNLGLGTAATQNTGTSGNTIPLLSASNTFGGTQTLNNLTVTGTCSGCGGGSSGITFTDGTHTVADATQLTVSGGTIGGTSPNATLTITGGSGITQLTGDVTAGPGSGSQAATLATVNTDVGTFQGLTVNGKGLVTAAVDEGYITGNQTITLSSDCSGSGTTSISVICTKTNGVNFAASATTDTTNASNISSGTLNAARLPSSAMTYATASKSGAAGTLTQTTTELIVFFDLSGGAGSVALPAAGNAGREIVIKDLNGNAGTNNLTVTVASAGTIDGQSSWVLSVNYQAFTFIDNGSSWSVAS